VTQEDWCLHHFDHLSEGLAQAMPLVMARMRGLCPVARSDEHGGFWVVSSYDEALSVAQDWATYSSAHGLSITANPGVIRNLPVEADPPEQKIFKRLVNPFFTPSAVARWEQPTRDLVNELIWASANRDEREFDRPDEFDAARERNRHLAFGAGPHRCVGSNLARMNMRVALEELLRRLDGIRLAPGTGPVRYHAGLTRSPLAVPITFTPARQGRPEQ